ncbi:MAG: IS4/IS5 family transposase [Chitinophagia bacterium]|nr:IS4/IS5 family transposase [Chitinophagia bacterium]
MNNKRNKYKEEKEKKELLDKLINETLLANIKKYASNKRRPKYTDAYYLRYVMQILKTGMAWYNLEVDCHYTSIFKKFCLWSNLGIFRMTWKELSDNYIYQQIAQNNDWFKNMIIDSSMIKNYKGIDCIGRNHYDRNRRATKISIICDQNKVPVSVSLYEANIHDVHTIEKSCENINKNIFIDKRRTLNIIGDKGYIINDVHKKIIQKKFRINIITPYRKNQKKKNTKHEKTLLDTRYKVEHIFNDLDKFKYIKDRYNKFIRYYESFIYISLISKYYYTLTQKT